MTTYLMTHEEASWWAAASEAHLQGRDMEWLHV